MTDTQIIDYFQKYKSSTCGRFTVTQLEYNTHPITKVSLKRRWAWVLSTLFLPLSMNAQAPKHKEPLKFEQSHKIKKPKPHKPTQKQNTGFRDSQGIPLTIPVMGKTVFRPKPKSITKK
jgi:ribosomal protein L4